MITESRIFSPNLLVLFKGIVKYVLFCFLIFFFLFHHALISLVIWNEKRRLNYFMKSIRLTALMGLWVLNVQHKVENKTTATHGRLLIANHMSYVDVLILFAHYPSLFVTSVEMSEVPVLGHIIKLAGCFMVERRKEKREQNTLNREITSMTQKLKDGFDVFLFPEGTSSNGRGILPFKSTFFQTAIDCKATIVPICLVYDEGLDIIPWYGKMTFPDHLFSLCMASNLKARVIELEAVSPVGDRSSLKNLCHERITSAYSKH